MMFWTEKKLRQRIDEIKDYRYKDQKQIDVVRFRLEEHENDGLVTSCWEEKSQGYKWVKKDSYGWVSFDFGVPDLWQGKQVVGIFDFRLGAEKEDFEALVYLNGKPYQGIDQNHKEVFFSQDKLCKTTNFKIRIWSGLLEGKIRQHFKSFHIGNSVYEIKLAYIDGFTDDLYYTSEALLQVIGKLDEKDPFRVTFLSELNKVYNLIDWSYPGSEEFYKSIEAACSNLNSFIRSLDKNSLVSVSCVGHTHIDVAWLWQLKHTREKCARSFSTALRLMEQYPEYYFLQTQPQLYEYIKMDYPEIYQQIKEQIKNGRWEADGAMWLEADCNIPSGESLVRQILFGNKFLNKEFGTGSKYLWLPDVFGYSWALPQILKKSGIEVFMTTKISWSEYNQMPHDTFWWRGIDGTKILTHFITAPEDGFNRYTYNGYITADMLQGEWEAYKDKAINKNLLLAYGYGDGGGGPTRDMLELRRRFDKIPGMPNVKTTRADEYFESLKECIEKTNEYVHTWDGELYLEYHRGTYTSQANIKRYNRKLELLYRRTEWLQSLACLTEKGWSSYDKVKLDQGWKMILRNQNHDIIPGSAIAEVYKDAEKEYNVAEEIAKELTTISLENILNEEIQNSFVIGNSSNWHRSDFVSIKKTEGLKHGVWRTQEGRRIVAQENSESWLLYIENIEPLGFETIFFEKTDKQLQKQVDMFVYSENRVESPYFIVEWNALGQLTSIYDQLNKREVLQGTGNRFEVFEDKPTKYDAWDIELFYMEKKQEIKQIESVELIELGNLKCVIRFKWCYKNSRIEQDMILYSSKKRIDFETKVDWREHNQLLKTAFTVDIRATEATYDIQFGNVKRSTTWNTSWDYAKFETIAHQWVDLSEYGYGVSLLNDCKYGHDIKDKVMRLTLIKSAVSPDPQADQGLHQFTYSIYPHKGDWRAADTVKEAFYLNEPLFVHEGELKKLASSLFDFVDDNIIVDAIKKAEVEDCLIIRLHEFAGGKSTIKIGMKKPVAWWCECDLMEKASGPKNISNDLEFEINPYEIKTFEIKFE